MADTVVHIPGTPIAIGTKRRQLCCWCGAALEDWDAAEVAVCGPGGLNPWPIGSLLRVDGRCRSVIGELDEGGSYELADLPPDWCGAEPLPDNVVRLRACDPNPHSRP